MLTGMPYAQFLGWRPSRAMGNFPCPPVSRRTRFLRRVIQRGKIATAPAQRRDAGELRAEKHDLRRIVAPEQQHDQRARRAITGRHAGAAEIKPEHALTESEQQSGDDRAKPDMMPTHGCVRKELENHREQERENAKREDVV